MRVNARFDMAYEKKIQDLMKVTRWSLTDLLKAAIDFFHEKRLASSVLTNTLKKNKFIACGKGGARLSQNYKTELSQSLKRKL